MPNETPQTLEDWVSVADAAAAFGVSIRAIQKRCRGGKINARRIETAQGIKWEIDANELPKSRALGREPRELRTRTDEPAGREPANFSSEQDASYSCEPSHEPANLVREPANQQDANRRTEGRELDANPRTISIEREAELKEEIRFLRGIIEGQQRDAAELRAALRKALEIVPRQLTTGTPVEQVGTATQSTPEAPANAEKSTPAPPISPDEVLPVQDEKAPEIAANQTQKTPSAKRARWRFWGTK